MMTFILTAGITFVLIFIVFTTLFNVLLKKGKPLLWVLSSAAGAWALANAALASSGSPSAVSTGFYLLLVGPLLGTLKPSYLTQEEFAQQRAEMWERTGVPNGQIYSWVGALVTVVVGVASTSELCNDVGCRPLLWPF